MGRQRQSDFWEFEASLVYTVRPCLERKEIRKEGGKKGRLNELIHVHFLICRKYSIHINHYSLINNRIYRMIIFFKKNQCPLLLATILF